MLSYIITLGVCPYISASSGPVPACWRIVLQISPLLWQVEYNGTRWLGKDMFVPQLVSIWVCVITVDMTCGKKNVLQNICSHLCLESTDKKHCTMQEKEHYRPHACARTSERIRTRAHKRAHAHIHVPLIIVLIQNLYNIHI